MSNRKIALSLIIIILANIILEVVALHSAYIIGGDNGLWSINSHKLMSPLFIWSYYNYSGYHNNFTLSNPLGLAYNILLYLLGGLKWGRIIGILSTTIFRVLAGTGMFLLVYHLLNKLKHPSNIPIYSGIFASFLFTMHYQLFSNFGLGISHVALLPFSVLLLLLFVEKVHANESGGWYFILSIISISFEISLLNYAYIIQGFLVLLIISLFLAIFSRKGYRIKVSGYLALILLLSLLINTPLIVMAHTAASLSSNELQMLQSNSAFDFQNYALLPLFGYNINVLPNSGGLKIYNILFDTIIAIISISSIFYIRKEHDNKTHLVVTLVIALIILLILGASTHKPFGELFSWLYTHINYLIVFRYGISIHYEVLFIVSALSGFTVGKLLERLKSNKNLQKLAIAAFVLIMLYYLYAGLAVPITSGTQSNGLPYVNSIPSYVKNTANYINSEKGYYSVATLPVDDDWHLATWYSAPDIYSSLLNSPVYTGGFAESEFFFPVSQDDYRTLGITIQQSITNADIANGLGIFGIKYIIVQNNTANKSFSSDQPLIPYSLEDIYSNLNDSTGISISKTFDNTSIYTNAYAVPLVYATNIFITNAHLSTSIINYILNRSINTTEYSIYSRNFSGSILWYGQTNIFHSNNTQISTITNFSKPNITFSYDTPTHIIVHIHNATTPFYLIFRETYDPYWNAYYQNDGKVPQLYHIAVNGFANAWYINKTGNFTMTLYYAPQTVAWVSWGVGITALVVTIILGYLLYSSKYKKGRRKSAHKV